MAYARRQNTSGLRVLPLIIIVTMVMSCFPTPGIGKAYAETEEQMPSQENVQEEQVTPTGTEQENSTPSSEENDEQQETPEEGSDEQEEQVVLDPVKTTIKGFCLSYKKEYRKSVKDTITINPAYGRKIYLKRYDPYLKKWVTEKTIKTPDKKKAKVKVRFTGTWRSYPRSKWKLVAPATKQREESGKVIPPLKKAQTKVCRIKVRKFHYAKHAVVLDAETGKCVYAYGATTKTFVASVRKMMTGVLLAEHKKPGDKIKIRGTHTNTITLGLKDGDIVRMKDLMYSMFLPSSNDAASASAFGVAGSKKKFLKMMNKKAKKLGMKKTKYTSPVGDGLQKNATTTVYDQALLGKYLMTSDTTKFIRKVILKKHYSFTTLKKHMHFSVSRGNMLLGTKYKSIGIKTGYNDQARWCFCNAWKYKGRLYISVVSGNPTRAKRWTSVKALTDFTKFAVKHKMKEITVKE